MGGSASGPPWPLAKPIFDHPQAQIWSEAPTIPLGTSGIVIGHLFTKEIPSRRVQDLDKQSVAAILDTHGQHLIDHFWGGYVAAIATGNGPIVLRDPSGALPCLYREDERGVWLSNDARTATHSNNGEPSASLGNVARFLCGLEYLGRSTCVEGLIELWPGERLSIAHGKPVIEPCWTPWDFANAPSTASSGDAATALRETVMDCARSWADIFPSILLGVSGGLDSSIVARSAHGHCPDLRLLTMVGPDPAGDETGYARQIAEAVDLPLDVRGFDIDAIDIATPNLAHLPWPVASYFTQAIDTVHRKLGSDRAIHAYFTGNGGDNIFCSMGSARPAADRLISQGPSLGALKTVRDVARLTDSSLADVAGAAWRLMRRHRQQAQVDANLAGLSHQWLEAHGIASEPPPWPQPAECLLPGKAMHVRLLARAMKGHELYSRAHSPPQIAPLLAQPIVELCLQLPTWQWIEGGRDRAVARAAFADLLPRTLIDRSSKGGPTGFMIAVYRRNARQIHEMLMEGILMREGLLDPTYVQPVEDHHPGAAAKMLRLLNLASTECWVRNWSGHGAPESL